MRSTRVSLLPRPTGAAALAAPATGVVTGSALAHGLGSKPVADCPPQTLVHPFLSWHDQGSSFLAPAGAFETTPAGWTLSRGAGVVAGNEPSHVNTASDASSLSLPT